MKVTLDIPDGIVCGFFNGVEILTDRKTTKLPREQEK